MHFPQEIFVGVICSAILSAAGGLQVSMGPNPGAGIMVLHVCAPSYDSCGGWASPSLCLKVQWIEAANSTLGATSQPSQESLTAGVFKDLRSLCLMVHPVSQAAHKGCWLGWESTLCGPVLETRA
jgi:hypothetical protein